MCSRVLSETPSEWAASHTDSQDQHLHLCPEHYRQLRLPCCEWCSFPSAEAHPAKVKMYINISINAHINMYKYIHVHLYLYP